MVTAPGAAVALAADEEPPLGHVGLRPALLAHRTVAGQMHAYGVQRAKARRKAARRRAGRLAAMPPVLQRIAQCESHGDPHAIGGGGLYRGAFQFSRSTWASVGGQGDPAAASLAEQYRRAAMLLERSGTSQWPVCGA